MEAAVQLAQQRDLRQRDVVEVQRADLAGALAHLVLLAARRLKPLRVEVDDEDAHAAVAGSRVGARQHATAKSATGALWIQSFAPLSSQPLSVARRRRADVGEIGAGLRLGQAVGDLGAPPSTRPQVALALRVACRSATSSVAISSTRPH